MPDELKGGGTVTPITREQKIAIIQVSPQATDANADLVEAVIPDAIQDIPEHTERQTWNFHCYGDVGAIDGPGSVGDVYEISFIKNGTEISHMTHSVNEAIAEGMELRPYVNYVPGVTAAFTPAPPAPDIQG